MANPYHDANGKFCSRNGMRASIQELIKNDKVSEALQLTTDLKEIDDAVEAEKLQADFTKDLQKKSKPLSGAAKQRLLRDFVWNKDTGPEEYVNLLEKTGVETISQDAETIRIGLEKISRAGYDEGERAERDADNPRFIDEEFATKELLSETYSQGVGVDEKAFKLLEDVVSTKWHRGFANGSWDV